MDIRSQASQASQAAAQAAIQAVLNDLEALQASKDEATQLGLGIPQLVLSASAASLRAHCALIVCSLPSEFSYF